MKTLSLKQPWAELIIQGKKKVELRTWKTKFRGDFFVHASKNPDEEAMKRFGFENLPLGFVVGKVRLVDVKDYTEDKEKFVRDKDLHLATEDWGNFGFILENPEKIEPIPAKGKLGFWDFSES